MAGLESAKGNGGRKRVLIADDDESTRVLLADQLADQESIELVGQAKDADEAVELAAELEPDVAVLDWAMPGGGGARAAQAIKANSPDVRIVALTGMDPMEASYEMMSAGAVAFLQKGGSVDELVETIHSAPRG
jgi:DNA-binding NarL/FixJ family response regulator